MKATKMDKFLNSRGTKTLIMTIILFTIGLSSYLINKSLEHGGFAIPVGILLVWGLLYITKIDEIIFR